MRSVHAILGFGLLACAQSTTPSTPATTSEPAQQPSEDAAPAEASPTVDARVEPGSASAPMPSCSSQTTRPGDTCSPVADDQCGVSHCGAQRLLECRDGRWALADLPWEAGGSPWDFACAPEQATAANFCSGQVQCCGQPVAQPSGCPIEGGCELCPASEPEDGAPCTLPTACDGQPEPRVIDCYYKCCCYGTATWAQCDGTRWHLATQCTPK